jgi:hypothetical protein
MKKFRVAIFVAALMMFLASSVFAKSSIDVDVDNTNTLTATGGNANQSQNQKQQQLQKQNQNQKAEANSIVNESPDLIVAPLLNAYVGAPVADSKGWAKFVCGPLFQVFTIERINNMLDSGSFWDSKGSVLDAIMAKRVRAVVHEKFSGKADNRPIVRLDWIPSGKADKLLGEFQCDGQYGWPVGASLARCLHEAKQQTNTTRVVVWFSEEKDGKNSGFSIGSGAAASKMFVNNGVDESIGSVALGGLLGSTYASVEKRYNVKLWAFNDGPTNPPDGLDVCKPPMPPVVQAPPPPTCDASSIRIEIEILKRQIAACKYWGIDNMRLRFLKANKEAALAKCTGENGYYSDAIKDYELAEKNYLKGKDIKANRAEADQLLQKVYWNWAAVIREVYGRDAEIAFAQSKKMTTMPSGINEIKR